MDFEKTEKQKTFGYFKTFATRRIKYLGINLPKESTELYTEKHKTLMREIKDDINRWRDISYSWVGRINIVKMMTRLAHWKLYTLAENYPEYMDRYSITMERLKMAIPWNASSI